MRKILSYINSTFNGIVTGDPSKDKTDFMVWTTEAFIKVGTECLLKTMETVDTLLLGRRTYEDLSRKEKWPSVKDWPDGDDLTLALGHKINSAHKLVVTHNQSLNELKWGVYEAPKLLAGNNMEEQIKNLKNDKGGDIIIFGSPALVRSLTDANLIDEYQIQLRPVVMNVGEYLFSGIQDRKDFHLIDVKPLADGTLFIRYKPI